MAGDALVQMKTTKMRNRGWQLCCFMIAVVLSGCDRASSSQALTHEPAAHSASTKPRDPETPARHQTTIRQPPPVLGAVFRVEATGANSASYEGYLKCAACHSLRSFKAENAQSSHLDEFHQGLQFSHGKLSCVSCHNPGDNYSTLRLADGRSIPFEESMALCAQCHGPQYRDYEHGAHGGMAGYWDLNRGERTRNHCQHCHDPHVPNYPKFFPAAVPKDRFQPSHGQEGANHGQ